MLFIQFLVLHLKNQNENIMKTAFELRAIELRDDVVNEATRLAYDGIVIKERHFDFDWFGETLSFSFDVDDIDTLYMTLEDDELNDSSFLGQGVKNIASEFIEIYRDDFDHTDYEAEDKAQNDDYLSDKI